MSQRRAHHLFHSKSKSVAKGNIGFGIAPEYIIAAAATSFIDCATFHTGGRKMEKIVQ